jgi:hypothetical protein
MYTGTVRAVFLYTYFLGNMSLIFSEVRSRCVHKGVSVIFCPVLTESRIWRQNEVNLHIKIHKHFFQFLSLHTRARAQKWANRHGEGHSWICPVANAPKMTFQSLSGMRAMRKRWDVFSYCMRSLVASRNQDEQTTLWLTFAGFLI